MSKNVSSRWPSRISEEGLWICLDLVGQDNDQVQRLSESSEFVQMCVEFLLTFTEILAANVFAPEM